MTDVCDRSGCGVMIVTRGVVRDYLDCKCERQRSQRAIVCVPQPPRSLGTQDTDRHRNTLIVCSIEVSQGAACVSGICGVSVRVARAHRGKRFCACTCISLSLHRRNPLSRSKGNKSQPKKNPPCTKGTWGKPSATTLLKKLNRVLLGCMNFEHSNIHVDSQPSLLTSRKTVQTNPNLRPYPAARTMNFFISPSWRSEQGTTGQTNNKLLSRSRISSHRNSGSVRKKLPRRQKLTRTATTTRYTENVAR